MEAERMLSAALPQALLLNKQIAGELGIAEDTVKIHRRRVMQKLGIDSVAELVRLCEQAGVAPAQAVGK